jgi:hypothetical protein
VPRCTGEIRCDDPDGLVTEACFVLLADAIERLRRVPNDAMRLDLLAYLERTTA